MKIIVLILLTIISSAVHSQTCESNNAINFASFSSSCNAYTFNCGSYGGSTSGFVRGKYSSGNSSPSFACSYISPCPGGGEVADIDYFTMGNCSPQYNGLADENMNPNDSSRVCGSIVLVENQILAEVIPVTGGDFNLIYSTGLQAEFKKNYQVVVPISGDPVRDSIDSFDLDIKIAGSSIHTDSFLNNQINFNYVFDWDGLDHNSQSNFGPRSIDVILTQNYTSVSIPILTKTIIGGFRAEVLGLGKWLPSNFKFYNHETKQLFFADGSIQNSEAKVFNLNEFIILADDESEAYVFHQAGFIKEIRTPLIGTVVHTFNYDSNWKMQSISSAFNRTTTFNSNSNGLLTSITAPNGKVTSITLDSSERVVQVTNPLTQTYTVTYGSNGLMSSFTKPGSQTTSFSYDAVGRLTKDQYSSGYFFDLVRNISSNNSFEVKRISKMGRENNYTESQSGTYTSKVKSNPNGSTFNTDISTTNLDQTISRSGGGIVNSSTRSNHPQFGKAGRIVTSAYSGFQNTGSYSYLDRVLNISLSNPSDPFSITSYSENRTYDYSSNVVSVVFSPSLSKFSSTSALGLTSSKVIDQYERPVTIEVGNLNPVNFLYTQEHLTQIQSGGRITEFSYQTSSKLLSTIENAKGETTGFVYDSAERLSSVVLPDLRTIQYGYDSNGNLISITPPGRPVHSFVLNSDEQLSGYQPPSLSGITNVITTNTYNDDKQLTAVVQPDGDYINFSYNSTTGLLDSITTNLGATTVFNDLNTQLPNYFDTHDGVSTSLIYNGTVARAHTTSMPDGSYWSFGLTYASTGNRTAGHSVLANGNSGTTINYAYNTDAMLSTIGDLQLTYSFPNGLLFTSSLGTGSSAVDVFYSYDSFGDLAQYEVSRDTTDYYDLSLTRDSLGRIVQKEESIQGISSVYEYEFDVSGRLVSVEKDSVLISSYVYDQNNNRSSGSVSGQSVSATYNDQDWLTNYNVFDFTYSANGDLLTKTNSLTSEVTSYNYDSFGNLRSVTLPNSSVVTYEIDGLNRRVGKRLNGTIVKRWIYMDQYRIAAELSATGAIEKEFVYATKSNIPDYFIEGGEKYKVVSDHLGSPRLVVKQSDGTVVYQMNHDEFGRVVQDSHPGYLPFGFAGGLYDSATKLVRFGARDFDSEFGRWTTKDPIRFNGGDTNLYGYTANNPVNFTDPSGLCPMCIGAAVGAVSSGLTTYAAGGDAKAVAVSAAVGAVAGAASMGVSAFATSASATIVANAGIGLVASVGTQIANGTSFSNLNYASVAIGALAGGFGSAAGLGAGTAVFYGTPVIGRSVGVGLARTNEFWAALLTGAAIGTTIEGAGACR